SNSELMDDPLVEFSRNNLRVAAAKYEELLMRIDSARIEQDTARAAFKYRYSVVRPASVPKKPVKPDLAIVILAAFVLAMGAGVVIGSVRDWWTGRLVEAWQVERALDLPVLSQVKLS
ncbi:MAG TPA: chain-length determining protein, partial [Archangium sp.]